MDVVIQLAVLFLSIMLHEVAHGYASYRLGDPTARYANRITLNPLAHIDLVGSILLPLFLVLVHSPVLFGWAKPVPFNPAYFRDPKKGIMIVGAAGPLTNLALAVLAGLIVRVSGVGGVLGYFLLSACIINVALGVFNLIPIPPLDGSRVVMGLLPWSALSFYLRLERYGVFIVFALLWIGVLDYVVRPVTLGLVRLLIGP